MSNEKDITVQGVFHGGGDNIYGFFCGGKDPKTQLIRNLSSLKYPQNLGWGAATPFASLWDAHETVVKYSFNALINLFSR